MPGPSLNIAQVNFMKWAVNSIPFLERRKLRPKVTARKWQRRIQAAWSSLPPSPAFWGAASRGELSLRGGEGQT